MKFKIYITLLLLCILHLGSFGQDRKIDSLKNLLKNQVKEDTNTVQILYKLCFFLIETEPKESFRYGNRALELSKKLNYPKGLAASYNNLGSLYDNIGKRKEAIDFFYKSFKIKKELNDFNGLSSAFNNLGVIYKRDGDFNKALEYYHLSRNYSQLTNNSERIISLYRNFGQLFIYLNNRDSSVYYLNKAKVLSKNNSKLLFEIYSSLALVYSTSNQIKLTIPYADTAYFYFNKLKEPKPFSFIPLYKATAYDVLEKLDSADKYFEIYKSSVTDTTNHEKIEQLYFRLANFNYKLFKINKKTEFLEKAFLYSKKSMKHYVLAFNLKKSQLLSNINRQIEVKDLESEIENSKKEQEISNLKSNKQQLIIYAIGLFLVLLVIFSLLLYKRFKLTSKQKQIIDEKNLSIMDSLRYAKRIQTSLLPTEKYIQRILNKKDKKTND